MDTALITAAIGGIKFAKDSFSALLDLKIEIEAQNKIHAALKQLGEVHENLFSLREQLFELQSKNQELHNQLNNQNQWVEQISNYEMSQTIGGAVVYAFKSNPMHYACPTCISSKQIHILQDTKTIHGTFICPNCKATYPVKQRESMAPIRIQRA